MTERLKFVDRMKVARAAGMGVSFEYSGAELDAFIAEVEKLMDLQTKLDRIYIQNANHNAIQERIAKGVLWVQWRVFAMCAAYWLLELFG